MSWRINSQDFDTNVPPPPAPTSRPPFDLNTYAANVIGANRLCLDDVVLMCVPDVSWSEAHLDFDELRVIRSVDGLSPVLLLESSLEMPREQLRSILFLLVSRGVLTVCEPETASIAASSGFFRRGPHGIEDAETTEIEAVG